MSTKGFDITDEGYYILTYRDWDTNLRDLHRVAVRLRAGLRPRGAERPGLRLVRLVSVLAAHMAFAWAFVTWLQVQPVGVHLSRAWRWAAGLGVVASGGVIYGWLP